MAVTVQFENMLVPDRKYAESTYCLYIFIGLAVSVTVVFLFLSCEQLAGDVIEEVDDTLQLVHIIFRHGDRTPERSALYPTDPHINHTYFPYGYGQLTNAGKQRQFKMGRELYRRYHKFIGPTYFPDEIKAISTDYTRTKMSMQLVLAALFPPEGDWAWNKSYPWQPIPYDYTPYKDDYMFFSAPHCAQYSKKMKQIYQLDEVKTKFKIYSEMREHILKYTEIDIFRKPSDALNLYISLKIQNELNLSHPSFINRFFPQPLEELATYQYILFTYNTELKKILMGKLVKYIADETWNKISGRNKRKVYLYSSHEMSIAGLMRVFGIFNPHIPPYSAYLSIELHIIDGTFKVKIYYRDYLTDALKLYKLPNCEEFCPINDFLGILQKYSSTECP